jgi:hypothetical protein
MSNQKNNHLFYLLVKEYINELKSYGCFGDDGKLKPNEFSIIQYGYSLN